jgi:O-antigen/teichoic acid export membrane protein
MKDPLLKENTNCHAETNGRFLDSEYLKHDLKGHSIRGGAVTMAAQALKFLLHTGSTVILARLLTPQDFGMIAMVASISGFVALFKDMGLSMATIQKAEINHSQVSTLFWINVAVSFVLALVLAMGAPIISWFYGEPRLTLITLVLSGTFIFSGFTIQHRALLRRHMRFSQIAVIDISSICIGITTGIIMAWYGAAYWALVGMSFVTSLSQVALVWVFCRWRPDLPVRGAGVLSMVRFGGHLTGTSFVDYFARNADNILIGKFIGADALGLYAKAYNLFMMPITQIRSPLIQVAMPVLSSLQNQPKRYTKYYQRLIDIIASLTIPLTLYCAIEANFLIRSLLGQQWLGAVFVFRILAIAALIQSIAGTRGLVLISHGFSDRFFYFGVFNSIVTVASFIVGLPFGINGVAVGYTVAKFFIFIPSLFYCFHKTPITVSLFIKTLVSPMIVGMVAAMCMILIKYTWADDSFIFHIVDAAVFTSVYSALSCCRQSVRETLKLILKRSPIIAKKSV